MASDDALSPKSDLNESDQSFGKEIGLGASGSDNKKETQRIVVTQSVLQMQAVFQHLKDIAQVPPGCPSIWRRMSKVRRGRIRGGGEAKVETNVDHDCVDCIPTLGSHGGSLGYHIWQQK